MVDPISADSHFLPVGPRGSSGHGRFVEVAKLSGKPAVLAVVLGDFVDVEDLDGVPMPPRHSLIVETLLGVVVAVDPVVLVDFVAAQVDAISADSHFLAADLRYSAGLGSLVGVTEVFGVPVVLAVVPEDFVDSDAPVGVRS